MKIAPTRGEAVAMADETGRQGGRRRGWIPSSDSGIQPYNTEGTPGFLDKLGMTAFRGRDGTDGTPTAGVGAGGWTDRE